LKSHCFGALAFAKNFIDTRPNAANLTKDEVAAIHLYTQEWGDGGIYRPLNTLLRMEDRSRLKSLFPYLGLLVAGLRKLPKRQATAYRGVKRNLSAEFATGNRFFWWSVTSCTDNLSLMESPQFLGKSGVRTMFQIDVLNCVQIERFSSIPFEAEVILLPGTYLEVVSSANLGNDLFVVKLKEILPDHPMIS